MLLSNSHFLSARVVPICPERRDLLTEAFERAEPGATSVAPMASRPGVNLRTYLERIIGNAGHTLWPRLLQNLRASSATDWVEKYPSHVVAKWLGHSPKVAAQHSLMSRDHHFVDVVGGGESSPLVGADGGQGSQSESSVKRASIATRNATPQASASGSTESHKTTEPAATIQVAAGSSVFAPVTKTGQVAGTGTEQTRFHSGNRRVASVCNAECDVISADRIELLARAVVLVAGMSIPDTTRGAVLAAVAAKILGGA